MRLESKRRSTEARTSVLSIEAAARTRDDRFLERADKEAVHTIADDFRHRSAGMGDHRRAARHRLDDAEAERLVEADEVEQGPRSGKELAAAIGTDGADVRDPFSVEPGLDGSLEVLVDPG